MTHITENYIEITDARSDDAHKTGLRAGFDTADKARESFENVRSHAVTDGGFLLDLYIEGDLSDTLEIGAGIVEQLTGEKPQPVEFYARFEALTPLSIPVPNIFEQAIGYSPNEGDQARWLGMFWEPAGDEARIATRWIEIDAHWHAYLLYVDHPAVRWALTGFDLGSTEDPAEFMLIFDLKNRTAFAVPFMQGKRFLSIVDDPRPAFGKQLAGLMDAGHIEAAAEFLQIFAPSPDEVQSIVLDRMRAQETSYSELKRELDAILANQSLS